MFLGKEETLMTGKVKGILFSVILIVIALLMLPIVIDSVAAVLVITGISAYNGVEAIVGLIPLLVTVGIIIVAIINGLWAMKKDE
jgi:hypothetical protein